MLDVDVITAVPAAALPPEEEIRRLLALAIGSAGIEDGHVAVEFVGEARIAELNRAHRGRSSPTDVLSFPIDGADEATGAPRELGDIVICPEHATDVREALVHGALHLAGMDHEADDGEMLALQREILSW